MAQVVDPLAYAWLLHEFSRSAAPSPLHPTHRPEPSPDFQADLVRPDDLLTLHVAGYNLKPTGDASPALGRIDAAKDAVLVVTFPPQNIAETAYYVTANPTPQLPGIPQQPSPPPGVGPAPGLTAARLAGFTRLAFRVAANAPMPAIPYSIEGLLDWSGFEPVVSALADIPPQPSPGEIAAAPAIAPPGAKETAIELPYRLTLSPNHNIAWRHAMAPVTHSSRTELWHTRLAAKTGDSVTELSALNTAPLRAIWSLDYNPARAFDPDHQGPKKTDRDPDLGVTDISPNDRHQIVILTSAFHGYGDAQNAPFVPTPVDAQMLMLSPLGGWLRSRGHWDPPHALRFIPRPPLGFAADLPPIANDIQVAERAPVEVRSEAQPIADGVRVAEGIAPGGTVAVRPGVAADNRFVKPKLARPTIPPIMPGILIVGDRLDLSEWVHVAAQGRDHYVRIVYEGHLYPFGHRAALIKITERKFSDTALPEGGTTPVAHMIQREYIVVREPEKSYRGQLNGKPETLAGRKMPLTKIRLTTLVTPDLCQPLGVFGLPPSTLPHTDFSFWIQVGSSVPQDFLFHAIATDISGHEIEFTTPLIFASLTDTGGSPNLANIQKIYRESGDRRICPVPKQKMTYAPRSPADTSTDNTTLVTSALYFDTDSHPSLVASFGGYMPILYKAAVHIPAIEQLLGTDTNTTIRLYDPYIQNDLDPHAGVFAEIVKDTGGALVPDQMPVTFTADKAGGIATPNLNLSNLSRAHGPLAGSAANAAQDKFDAGDFFGGALSPDLIPKLFGSISLTDLLPVAAGASTAKNAPKTQFIVEDGGKTTVVKFNWTPDVRKYPDAPKAGVFISFTPNDNGATALTITGEIRKPVAVPPNSPGPGSFAFNGSLTNFRLDILNAIALHFVAFTFSAGSNKKLDVKVDLDQNKPFEFEGDLAFVQGLSSIIPPGTFGDGPSIDLTPAPGVHVGYGVTLPPAAVGVFSLENIKLSAGLDLPLLTGKPLVDFSFAERAHPFLLTVSLLGGGGFLHVQLDAEGMKMLEAAFEFGANASINLGVASGGVHIMAGIYFSMQIESGSTKATLQGYLRMGGELSVLGIISMSLEFVLSFTYDSEGKASGRATLTVAVKVLFFSTSVAISVEKRFGGSGSDPTFAQLITSPGVWNSYAGAFA
jgi:hypothetical protein